MARKQGLQILWVCMVWYNHASRTFIQRTRHRKVLIIGASKATSGRAGGRKHAPAGRFVRLSPSRWPCCLGLLPAACLNLLVRGKPQAASGVLSLSRRPRYGIQPGFRGAGEKKETTNPRTSARSGLKKVPTYLFFFFLFFSKKFLLRFCVFLGMGNPETAKNLFWKFFGHDPNVHLMAQKNIFFRCLFCTFLAILRPLQTP